jgi:hypothetical protein
LEETLQASQSTTTWVKSGRCDTNACVEAALVADGVQIRNSGNTDGPVVTFSKQEWVAFVGGVRDGDFDFGWMTAHLG